MFLFFFSFAQSFHIPFDSDGNIDIASFLENADTPQFIKIDEDNESKLENYIDVDRTISTNFVVATKRQHEFYKSSITIAGNVGIKNNYAFGTGPATGSGGGIFISYCQLLAEGNTNKLELSSNTATVGGGLCSISSSIYLKDCKLDNNIAYRYGGGIYYQGESENDVYNKLFCYSCTFNSNNGSEFGGGLSFSMAFNIYLQDCTIKGNKAAYNGAGVYSCNTKFLKIVNSKILDNVLTYSNQYNTNSKTNKLMNFSLNPSLSVRGGGGIAAVADYVPGSKNAQSQFISQRNCYGGNSAGNKAYTRGHGAGHAILVDGNCQLQSMSDDFNSPNDINRVVSVAGPQVEYPQSTIQSDGDLNQCGTMTKNSEDNEAAEDHVTPKNALKSPETSSVPSPSNYTYAATPITRLPKPTTITQKYTAKTFSSGEYIWKEGNAKTFTVKRTNFRTPHSTAHSTPHSTAFSTPHSTAHSTAHSTPHSTAHSTPHSTQHSTPHSTAHSTAHSTPHSTAHSTPHSTAHSTPHSTQHSTPHSTAHSTPHSTAHSTAFSTPHSTAHSTAHSTPNSTPHSTAHSTPHSTPFITPILTPIPSRSPASGWYVPPVSFSGPSTKSLVSTWKVTNTSTKILVDVNMTDGSGGYVIRKEEKDATVEVMIVVEVEANIPIEALGGEPTPNGKSQLPLIIGCAVGVVILILLISLLVWFITAHKRHEESSESCVEMAEETVFQVPNSSTTPVTNDNPLWTTSVMGDTDDPFKNDFEEEGANGFFNIKDTGLE